LTHIVNFTAVESKNVYKNTIEKRKRFELNTALHATTKNYLFFANKVLKNVLIIIEHSPACNN